MIRVTLKKESFSKFKIKLKFGLYIDKCIFSVKVQARGNNDINFCS